MNLITRAVQRVAALMPTKAKAPQNLSVVNDRGWFRIFESRPGAWQSDVEVNHDSVLAQATVFACITLIASDIGKLRLKLVELDSDGIWNETQSPAFSPVMRKPNRYQTLQKFIEQWLVSKLSHGNTYVLKQRDARGVVSAMYVLDPNLVKPLVAPNGDVYYELDGDDISRVPEGLPAVPASEIIHDRMVCLFHPLVGVSPIFACGLSATQALRIQQNSAKFFENQSRPSGILTAPGQISDDTATRLKEHWEKNFSGNNIGKVAVLGDALKYEAMSTNANDAQLVEQLKLSAEQVASVFHVPAYMVGAAPPPAYNNIQALNQQYYSQCLQSLIESAESLIDDGLGLPDVPGRMLGSEFDLDDLLRMDTATLTATLKDQVLAGIAKPNEARKRLNLSPVKGGDSPMMQQQQFSLEALAERDQDKPFAKPSPAPAPDPEAASADQAKRFIETLKRGLHV